MNVKGNIKSKKSIENIKSALISMMKVYPFEEINIYKLCKYSNINRTTFYHHFATISDVLYAISEEIIDEVTEIVKRNKNNLKIGIKKAIIYSLEKKSQFGRLLTIYTNLDKKIFDSIQTEANNLTDSSKELMTMFLLSGIKGIEELYFRSNNRYDQEELLETLDKIINWDTINSKF